MGGAASGRARCRAKSVGSGGAKSSSGRKKPSLEPLEAKDVEPKRPGFRAGRKKPKRKRSRADTAESGQAHERKETVRPKVACVRAKGGTSKRFMPKTGNVLAKRVELRSKGKRPRCRKSKTSDADPIHARLCTGKKGSKYTLSRTGTLLSPELNLP